MRSYKKAGWYELSLPDQWEVDEEDSPVAIWQPDGAGALQITAEQLPHHKSGDEMDCFLALRAFLSSVGHELDESSARRFSRDGMQGASTEYIGDGGEEDVFWRVWFLTNQETLLFLTYACRKEDQDAERRPVDEIIDSLRLIHA
jgi:hypothetical protein